MDAIINVVMNEDTKDVHKLSYLMMANELDGSEKAQETIIKFIKLQMSSQNTKYTGLTFLTNTLPRLDKEIFSKNCLLWLQLILKNLQESKETKERVLSYKVLNQILIRIDELNLQNLTRELSMCLVPNLLQCLCEFQTAEISFSATTIALCATLFPGVISVKRNFIETRIIETVNSIIDFNQNTELIKTLGFCYTKIYMSGSSLPSKWQEAISKLMNALNEFFNLFDMLAIAKPEARFKFENEKLNNFFCCSANMIENHIRNSKKLSFISAALSCLITGHYPTALPLPVEAILECLGNLTLFCSINPTQTLSGDTFVLTCITPAILCCVFDLLQALLTSCQTNLIVYTRSINQISLTTLEWLDKKGAFGKSIYLHVRCRCFRFLHEYLALLGINSCFTKSETSSILSFVLLDIQPFEFVSISNELTGNVSDLTSKNLFLCTKNSIQVLKSLLNYSLKSFPDVILYDSFQNAIIQILLSIYRNWFDLKLPYKDEHCRKELLESLKLLILNADRSINVPLETTFAILTEAHRIDNSPTVKNLSEDILNIINFILKSRIPSIRSNSTMAAMQKEKSSQGQNFFSTYTNQEISNHSSCIVTTRLEDKRDAKTKAVTQKSPPKKINSEEVALENVVITLEDRSDSDTATSSKKRKSDVEVICIDDDNDGEISDNPQTMKTSADNNIATSKLTTTIVESRSVDSEDQDNSVEHKSQDKSRVEQISTQADEILQYLVEN